MRTKRLYFSQELVIHLMRTGALVGPARCVSGIPAGAVIVGAGMDGCGNVMLTIAHPSFPEVANGEVPGTITPAYEHAYEHAREQE